MTNYFCDPVTLGIFLFDCSQQPVSFLLVYVWQGGFEIELIFGLAAFCLEQKDRGGRRKGMPSGVVDIASERGEGECLDFA